MKAEECQCIICHKQAVAFWPAMLDVPSQPYCRECLDDAKRKYLFRMAVLIDYEEKMKP